LDEETWSPQEAPVDGGRSSKIPSLLPSIQADVAAVVVLYRYRAFEYLHIHSHIIDILENTMKQLRENPPISEDYEATQGEIERRAKDRQDVLASIHADIPPPNLQQTG